MEIVFLVLLIFLLITALGSGYPVAFALPGSAIIAITIAALSGLIFVGDADAYFAHGGPIEWLTAAVMNFRGIYLEVERDTLIAIPLFVFMGIMLQRSMVAEDLLIAMAQLFGPLPGGLGIAVVFVGALLAATTGIVGATVIAMGLISLPVMLRHNYSVPLATGTINASGTLGQIIPPSIVLIILADQLSNATDRAASLRKADYKAATGQTSLPSDFDLTSTSAGEMFLGALLPGVVLVGLYMLYILVVAIVRPKSAPPVPYEGKYDLGFLKRILLALVPPLTLIFAVLGSIVLGIATVNQAGAIGAIGAMIMASYRLMEGQKRAFVPAILAVGSIVALGLILAFNDINIKAIHGQDDVNAVIMAVIAVAGFLVAMIWSGWRTFKIDDTLNGVMIDTAKTTTLVFIILLGAAMLTAAFRAFGGEELVRQFLTGLPGGFYGKFIVVMVVIFLLGFFLDFIEIAVVVVPIIAPILLADPQANITGMWLGVMIGLNMQTSFLTPPFGFALFYLRGVAPKIVKTIQMYKGVVPFIALQLVALVIVGLSPSLVNYLPNRVNLTSETAPPPRNPRLQRCVESYLFAQYDARGETLRGAIATARALDLSFLPQKHQSAMTDGLASAQATFDLVEAVRTANRDLAAYVPGYTPLHRDVRSIQAKARRISVKIPEIEKRIRFIMSSEGSDAAQFLRDDIVAMKAEIAQIEATVPATWTGGRKRYLELAKAETNVRNRYRRNVDDAYEPISVLLGILADSDGFAALKGSIAGLEAVIAEQPARQAMTAIKVVEAQLGAVKGASAVKSHVSKARRALKGNRPNRQKAQAELQKAMTQFAQERLWRDRAKSSLTDGLKAYDLAIRDTIGLRQQERLNAEQASEIASCQSNHRDISLNF